MAGNEDEPGPSTSPKDKVKENQCSSRFAIRKVMFPRRDEEKPTRKEMPYSGPPPIIVPMRPANNNKADENRTDDGLKALFKAKLGPTDYTIKNLNKATQIRADNAKSYSLIQKVFQEAKLEFYTYNNEGPKFEKFVMYGLYENCAFS